MIISHKHKFIFVKTKKTAGTSLEIALSKFCGPDDVITPIHPKDEAKRKELGYRGPQNYKVPFSKYWKVDYVRSMLKLKRRVFYNHMPSIEIMRWVDKDVWNSYFKFCFERNPFDKVISFYYWRYQKEPRPTISEIIESGEASNITGFELYTREGEIVVDKVFLFEEIAEAMVELQKRFNLEDVPELPNAKGGSRKDRRNHREILSATDRDKLSKVYARELAYFGYEW